MQRRDISKILLATAGASGTNALMQKANAQSCTAPCYTQTPAETAAGVTPVNTTYPPGNVLRYGTNTNPGTTNMTTAAQNAINQCVQTGGGRPCTHRLAFIQSVRSTYRRISMASRCMAMVRTSLFFSPTRRIPRFCRSPQAAVPCWNGPTSVISRFRPIRPAPPEWRST